MFIVLYELFLLSDLSNGIMGKGDIHLTVNYFVIKIFLNVVDRLCFLTKNVVSVMLRNFISP